MYEAAGGERPSRAELDYFILPGQTRLAIMCLQTDSGFDSGKFDDIRFGRIGAFHLNKVLSRVSTRLRPLLGI